MPPKYRKRPYRKRRYVRKRKSKSRLGRPSRGLSQSVYLFKRRRQEVVQLNAAVLPAGWQLVNAGVCREWSFALSDLTDFQEFVNLFDLYKITACKVEIFMSNSLANANLNENLICYAAPSRSGQTPTMDEDYFLNKQASKKKYAYVGSARPVTYYMKLNQLAMVYGQPTGVPPSVTDYATIRPRWVSTQEPTTEHYGLDTRIQLVNNTSLPNAFMKVVMTYYIACKGAE